MIALPAPFDVREWHRACAARGLALERFVAPPVGGVTELRVVLDGRPATAWVFRGIATLWAMMKCERCNGDVAIGDGASQCTVPDLVDAIAAAVPGVRCLTCRGQRR